MHQEDGIELLEFVTMMTVAFILGLIIFQFMIYGHQQMVINSAARELARQMAAHEWFNQDDALESACGGYDCSTGVNISLNGCLPVCLNQGGCVSVKVKSPLKVLNIPWVPIPAMQVQSTASAFCEAHDFSFLD